MIKGKVSCLQATYGRYHHVCVSLACFLCQDYENRELLILNNHPVPLEFEHPLVRIFNEPGYPTQGHCRNRLLRLSDGEWCRTWDDDDIYMPWAVSQGVARIGDHQAWRPSKGWFSNGNNPLELTTNNLEASWTFRTDAIRKLGGYRFTMADEHADVIDVIPTLNEDVGDWNPYCYCWGNGLMHASGMALSDGSLDERTARWKEAQKDVRPGVPLVPAFDEALAWYLKIAPLPEQKVLVREAVEKAKRQISQAPVGTPDAA